MAADPDGICAETNVEELITRFPIAARIFIRHGMGCVGCDVARFESLAEVAQIYQQPLAAFLAEIRSILNQGV